MRPLLVSPSNLHQGQKPVLKLSNKLTSKVVVCFILTLQDAMYAPKITVGLLRWFLLKRHSHVIYSHLKLLE